MVRHKNILYVYLLRTFLVLIPIVSVFAVPFKQGNNRKDDLSPDTIMVLNSVEAFNATGTNTIPYYLYEDKERGGYYYKPRDNLICFQLLIDGMNFRGEGTNEEGAYRAAIRAYLKSYGKDLFRDSNFDSVMSKIQKLRSTSAGQKVWEVLSREKEEAKKCGYLGTCGSASELITFSAESQTAQAKIYEAKYPEYEIARDLLLEQCKTDPNRPDYYDENCKIIPSKLPTRLKALSIYGSAQAILDSMGGALATARGVPSIDPIGRPIKSQQTQLVETIKEGAQKSAPKDLLKNETPKKDGSKPMVEDLLTTKTDEISRLATIMGSDPASEKFDYTVNVLDRLRSRGQLTPIQVKKLVEAGTPTESSSARQIYNDFFQETNSPLGYSSDGTLWMGIKWSSRTITDLEALAKSEYRRMGDLVINESKYQEALRRHSDENGLFSNSDSDDNVAIRRVFEGKKPCSRVVDPGAIEEAEKLGLVVRKVSKHIFDYQTNTEEVLPMGASVSLNEQVSSIYPLEFFLDNFSDLHPTMPSRIRTLYGKIANETLADAINLSDMEPPLDPVLPHTTISGSGKIEHTMVEGVLFGYPIGDVREYIRRNLSGEMMKYAFFTFDSSNKNVLQETLKRPEISEQARKEISEYLETIK